MRVVQFGVHTNQLQVLAVPDGYGINYTQASVKIALKMYKEESENTIYAPPTRKKKYNYVKIVVVLWFFMFLQVL